MFALKTNGKHSLDDVMRSLLRSSKAGSIKLSEKSDNETKVFLTSVVSLLTNPQETVLPFL